MDDDFDYDLPRRDPTESVKFAAPKKRQKVDSDIMQLSTQPGDSDGRGSFLGTLPYMAPEMFLINQGGPFGDLWALGVIAYELFYGFNPFYGETIF